MALNVDLNNPPPLEDDFIADSFNVNTNLELALPQIGVPMSLAEVRNRSRKNPRPTDVHNEGANFQKEPPTKKLRGEWKCLGLHEAINKNGGKRLQIEFSLKDRTFQPIGPNATHFPRLIGYLIQREVPFYYPSWEKVPGEKKELLRTSIEAYFDLADSKRDPQWLLIKEGIERLLADRYRGRKTLFRKVYLKKGDDARPETYSDDDWEKQLKFWNSTSFKAQSAANIENRKHQTNLSLHGSSSVSLHRYKKGDKHSKTPQGLLDAYLALHTKKGKWVTKEAEENYDKMKEAAQKQMDQASTSVSTLSAIDEEYIAQTVLGYRSDHRLGIGRTIKGTSIALNPNYAGDNNLRT